ncbi:MAG: hypothetical protein E6I11_16945 [Chloroflexi bacterium]|nr:MAG: hypothetical protein E6I11_16945 [Chloroflexota bacterium]
MRRLLLSLVAAIGLVAISTSGVLAGNVHFNKSNPPTFTDNGLTLTASGTIYGLGNGDVVVVLTATATPTATCTNPGGSSKVPGQNPAAVTVTGTQGIPGSSIINGHTPFNVTTATPTSPVPGAPACPNSSWTETITDMSWTSATITVYQPCDGDPVANNCTVVLTKTFTFSPPL